MRYVTNLSRLKVLLIICLLFSSLSSLYADATDNLINSLLWRVKENFPNDLLINSLEMQAICNADQYLSAIEANFIRDPRSKYRLAGISIIASCRYTQMKGILEPLLDDKDPEISRKSFNVLSMNYPDNLESYIPKFIFSKDSLSQKEAILLIAVHSLKSYIPDLLTIINDSSSANREPAIWAIGTFKDPLTIETLLNVLKTDEDGNIRARIIHALAQMQHPNATAGILMGLNDRDYYVRLSALDALNLNPNEKHVPLIIDLFKDPNFSVRKKAVNTLITFSNTELKREIVQALFSDDASVRQGAILVIFSLHTEEIVEPLTYVFENDSNEQNRILAILKLASYDYKGIKELLLKAKDDSSVEIRSIASWGLKRIMVGTTQQDDEVLKNALTNLNDLFGDVKLYQGEK